LDHATSARGAKARDCPAYQLCSTRRRDYCRPRPCDPHQRGLALYLADPSKQKTMGGDKSDHYPLVHKRAHVQPHQESPLRLR